MDEFIYLSKFFYLYNFVHIYEFLCQLVLIYAKLNDNI